MKKFITPSALTASSIKNSTVPVRVQTVGKNLFDVSTGEFKFITNVRGSNKCYLVQKVDSGTAYRAETLKEVKYFINCHL